MTNQPTYAVTVGDSNYGDYVQFVKEMDYALSKSQSTVFCIAIPVLYGQGTEKLAELYAKERGLQIKFFNINNNEDIEEAYTRIISELKASGAKQGVMAFGDSEITKSFCDIAIGLDIKFKLIEPS